MDVHDCVLHVTSSSGRVSFGKTFHNISEMRLHEYAVRAPNGGAVTPSLWVIRFGDGSDFSSECTSNVTPGYPVVIDNATLTHTVYDQPRVISRDTKKYLNTLYYEIVDSAGTAVTFADMTLYLSFVCVDPDWSTEKVMQTHWDLKTTPMPAYDFAYMTSMPDENGPRSK